MSPQFQAAKVHIDDSEAAVVRGLQSEWTMTDEWYSFRSDPRSKGARILATLDETTYKPMSGKNRHQHGRSPDCVDAMHQKWAFILYRNRP